MWDKIINMMALIAVFSIMSGLIIGIWWGVIGLKIAASGAVIFAADIGLAFLVGEVRKDIREGKGKNGQK